MPGRRFLHKAIFSLLLTACLSHLVRANNQPQTITSLAAYKGLDPCAQNCFFFSAFVPGCTYGVEVHIGCSWACFTGASNDCFCRGDKQPVATSFLSSCISSACTFGDPQIDVDSGVGLYTGYCSSLGYPVVAAATQSPSLVSTPAATTVYVTTTVYISAGGTERPGLDGRMLYLLVFIFIVTVIHNT